MPSATQAVAHLNIVTKVAPRIFLANIMETDTNPTQNVQRAAFERIEFASTLVLDNTDNAIIVPGGVQLILTAYDQTYFFEVMSGQHPTEGPGTIVVTALHRVRTQFRPKNVLPELEYEVHADPIAKYACMVLKEQGRAELAAMLDKSIIVFTAREEADVQPDDIVIVRGEDYDGPSRLFTVAEYDPASRHVTLARLTAY